MDTYFKDYENLIEPNACGTFDIKGSEWTLDDLRLCYRNLDDVDQTTIFMMLPEKQRRYVFGFEDEYEFMLKEAESRREESISDVGQSMDNEWNAYKKEWLRITGQKMWYSDRIDWKMLWQKKRQQEDVEHLSTLKNAEELIGVPTDHTSMQKYRSILLAIVSDYREKVAMEYADALVLDIFLSAFEKKGELKNSVSELDAIHMTPEAKRIMNKMRREYEKTIKFLKKASYQDIYYHEKYFDYIYDDYDISGVFENIKHVPEFTEPEMMAWFAI